MLNEFIEIGRFMIEAYKHAWPYLLITVPLAVLVNVSGVSKYIGKAFNSRPMIAILLATVVGAFSPFCSCGVIPIITALLISGVPLAPVMSFWLASPSMDPEIFFLSVSLLGMDLAIWRLIGTFAMSLIGGYITYFLTKINWLDQDVMKNRSSKKMIPSFKFRIFQSPTPILATPSSDGSSCSEKKQEPLQYQKLSKEAETPSCSDSSCSTSSCAVSQEHEERISDRIQEEGKKAVFMIIKFMTLAFFLEALIIRYLPQEWIVGILGSNNSFAIPVSAFIGIPLYTTNLTALGIMGGLLEQGMSPAAVLAFLIGGATTTVPAMAAVYGIVKRRVFILYVAFALGASLITAYLYQFVYYLMT
jgi:uncharacterized protein